MRNFSIYNLLTYCTVIGCSFTAHAAGMAAPTAADSALHRNIDEIVVTGTIKSISRMPHPYTISTVNAPQIETTGQSQLLSALSGRVPSMFVAERNIFGFGVSSGGSGGIKIRGIGNSPTNALLMMIDGQPQFASIFSHHVADSYGTENVEQVEVLRGPASVLYGSNAMGGVINIITKHAQKDGIHTSLKSQYGSYNTWRSSVSNAIRHGKFSSFVTLGYNRTDGLQDNFDFSQKSLYAKVGYDFSSHWKVYADYMLMNFIGNDPIYPKLSNPESTAVYHQDITRGESTVSLSNLYDKFAGNLSFHFSHGNHYIDDPNRFHSLDNRYGVRAFQNFFLWKGASGTAGFDFDVYTGEIPMSGGSSHTEGSRTTIGHKSITEYSPYVTISQGLAKDRITLNAGLRMANSSAFSTQWIPQGGIVYRPYKNWSIKGSVAKGFRNPSFRELYLYATANPDLDPESMMNYELSIGNRFSRYFDIDVTGYVSKGSNIIQTVDRKNVNTGEFTNKGIEIAIVSDPTDNLSIRATYSYMHTSLSNLTAAPKNQYFAAVSWKPVSKLKVDAELRCIGGLYVSDSMADESYALVNLHASYSVLRFLDLFVTFDNITDTQYTINRGYQMPGFNFSGGFNLNF